MYNRRAFNLTQYNISANALEMRGVATLEVTAAGSCFVRYGGVAESAIVEAVTAGGAANVRRYSFGTDGVIEMGARGVGLKLIHIPTAPAALIEMLTSGGYIGIYGNDIIRFEGIVIPPGSELVIDTDEMTVTLDGNNAIRYLTDDSVFFTLAPGTNIVQIDDGKLTGAADVYLIWKDRWL